MARRRPAEPSSWIVVLIFASILVVMVIGSAVMG